MKHSAHASRAFVVKRVTPRLAARDRPDLGPPPGAAPAHARHEIPRFVDETHGPFQPGVTLHR
ncbi:hypothetical protein BDI4_840011 [Burkholderia diffusa]|nr:hypothetical protein BDI4_840011 [Burkholderia diffusa]